MIWEILVMIAVLALYFSPAIMAYQSRKRNAGAILALNFFLGWTILGWIAAFIWSLTVDKE